MHIIITRPIEDSLELIRNLSFKNHVVTHLPLINIKKISNKNINFHNYKGIIFTSANAIKFLDTENIPKNIHCFCVGEATEKKAKDFGFYNAISAGGNVDVLIELIIRTFDKNLGRLLYVSSEFISKELDLELKKKGYSVERVVNYTSEPINQIEQNTLDYINKNTPDVIFVYSEKSAINLKDLIKKYSLVDVMVLSNLMCISKKTSKVLEFIKWKKVIFFNPGEEEFFLNKID
jgi:uroporphyrinogen-III synthase